MKAQKHQLKPLTSSQIGERVELLSQLIRGGRETSGPFARVHTSEGYYIYNRLSNRIIAGIPKGWKERGVIYLQRASIYNETLPRLASRSDVKTNTDLQKVYLLAVGQKLAGASGKGIPRGLPDPDTIPPKPRLCRVEGCERPECVEPEGAYRHLNEAQREALQRRAEQFATISASEGFRVTYDSSYFRYVNTAPDPDDVPF